LSVAPAPCGLPASCGLLWLVAPACASLVASFGFFSGRPLVRRPAWGAGCAGSVPARPSLFAFAGGAVSRRVGLRWGCLVPLPGAGPGVLGCVRGAAGRPCRAWRARALALAAGRRALAAGLPVPVGVAAVLRAPACGCARCRFRVAVAVAAAAPRVVALRLPGL
jgi:hypothetical protein